MRAATKRIKRSPVSSLENWQLALGPIEGIESYSYTDDGTGLKRIIRLPNGDIRSSSLRSRDRENAGEVSARDAFDLSWLTACSWPKFDKRNPEKIRCVDLFCGCGAMTLGAWEACRALGLQLIPILAVDHLAEAVRVYNENFPGSVAQAADVNLLLDGDLGAPPTTVERKLREDLGNVDLLLGGPPCQGHSDLNNHTRRNDPKNVLILRMARFAEIFRPRHIVIENVQGIRHDKKGAAGETRKALERLGYRVDEGLLMGASIGVAQKRRRFFMVASLNQVPEIAKIQDLFGIMPRSVAWAINDLLEVRREGTFDTAAEHSAVNKRRIDFLFDHGIYELPDEQRPDCHRLKPHDYKSVYGRLRPDEPAPTITTGFGSTGQGRFVHPFARRTLTPHEAARLQFIPDFFSFGESGRRSLQLLIGNAVPPKMAYAICSELLRNAL